MKSKIFKPNQVELERHQRRMALIEAISNGETEFLRCPVCHSDKLEFSYTHVPPNHYAIWYTCLECADWTHARLKGRPPGFDESLILAKYQKREEEAVHLVDAWWQATAPLRKKET